MSIRLNITLNDELAAKLSEIATERNVGLANVVRNLINEYQLSHAKDTENETNNYKS